MLKRKESEQMQLELVTHDLLVRPDHLLRKINAVIDFSFIHDLCAPLYCADNGRPAIDPEILFRMLFVGYLYGIRSEVRLCEEIQDNTAYRWFCGLGLTEKVPDHATISVNRKRRFRNNDIAEQIFQEILNQAQEKGLVGSKILYTDSTHVKALANKHKKVEVAVTRTPKTYIRELDAAVAEERKRLGKKKFDDKDDPPPTGKIQQSTSDPDSGQLHKEGKPDGFHYSEHRTVDSRHTYPHGTYGKYRFQYDPALDCYICPQGCLLKHSTTSREGFRQYCCDTETCQSCPRRAECFAASYKRKVVTRHVWQDDLDQADAFTKTPAGKNLYAWRKHTIERSFADAKQLHGFRYARMRGNANMREQAFLTAAVQNMKKMASLLWKPLSRSFRSFVFVFTSIWQTPCLA